LFQTTHRHLQIEIKNFLPLFALGNYFQNGRQYGYPRNQILHILLLILMHLGKLKLLGCLQMTYQSLTVHVSKILQMQLKFKMAAIR